ncbi:MAG: cob(I)yrinic acid a,c-diamide adenosyltransferase, partial [Pyrinomonadaceae bacterium]
MSIATKAGDAGRTALIGGERVSKADLRVEAYGTIDELTSVMGFARSICEDAEVREVTKEIQRELFAVSGGVANPLGARKEPPYVTEAMVEALTAHVNRIEGMEGLLSDWSLPGEHAAAAAYDVARTVCRRAERAVVRLVEAGEETAPQ